MKALKIIMLIVVSMVIFAFTSQLNPEKTITEMVAEKEDLSTLMTALETAELVESLNEEGPFTIFAPTNKAFENLPAGKLDDLLKPENKAELVDILKYHVVSGEIYASDLEGEKEFETLKGTKLKVKINDRERGDMDKKQEGMKKVMVNNTKISESDITASNGIIHIIEGVMIPSDVRMIGSTEK